jgi:hypothetical protein
MREFCSFAQTPARLRLGLGFCQLLGGKSPIDQQIVTNDE